LPILWVTFFWPLEWGNLCFWSLIMKKTFVQLILLSFLCTPAYAAKLEFTADLVLLAVDGKDVGWFGGSKPLELAAGKHKIALKYEETVEGANPRVEEFIHSEPLLLTLEVEEGQVYKLMTHPEAKKTPRQFAQNPKVKVVREDGGEVNFSMALLVERQQSKWETQTQDYDATAKPVVLSDMERLTSPVEATVKSQEAAIVASEATASVVSPNKASTVSLASISAANLESNPTASLESKMLSYWWNKASPADREAFLKKVRVK